MSKKGRTSIFVDDLAAIIATDIFEPESGDDPLFVMIFKDGLARVMLPSGKVMRACHSNIEEAIRLQEAAMTTIGLNPDSCLAPRIKTHRVPANCTGEALFDWLHSIGMKTRMQKPDGAWTEWQ